MALQSSTLRPGFLVSLKTSIRGNVNYKKREIEAGRIAEDGAHKASWETERTIFDPAEHAASTKARSKARSIITGICSQSAFGLLCPEAEAEALESAIAEARKVADDFNATARLSRISVYVITGKIAPDDVEAVKAINSEVRDLLADMREGIETLNVQTIREAASKAKSIGEMLTPDARARIQIAIDAARSSARRIVKTGETASQEIDRGTIRKILEARTVFLDMEDEKPVAVPASIPTRAIDFEPSPPQSMQSTPSSASYPTLDF